MRPTDDPQLRSLLQEWQVEDAPPALDARVLGARKPWWRDPIQGLPARGGAVARGFRKTLLAGAIAGMSAFLIVVTQAIPQTLQLVSPPPPAPFTVDSEYVRYAEDGSRTVEMYSTSYTNQTGAEVILGRTIADHPFGTALGRTLDAVLTAPAGKPGIRARALPGATVGVISGCSPWTCLMLEHWYFRRAEAGPGAPCAAGPVTGHETILGYPTAAVELPLPNPRSTARRPAAPRRITLWMAPDIGCFALRVSIEEQRPDGAFRLVSGKQALRVNAKP